MKTFWTSCLLLLCPMLLYAKPTINFDRLADAILVHENSIRFPYGCEHRVHGVLCGYAPSVARIHCLALCRRVYTRWDGSGDFFLVLNRSYALDKNWWRDVEKIYVARNGKR